MSMTGLQELDHAINTTNEWLKNVMQELEWDDRHRAYHAMRAVLHTLRDRLPVNEAVDLGAQLPMIIRGLYYEGWRPADKPVRERSREEFLAHVTDAFLFDVEADSEQIVRAVFKVLSARVSPGEIEDIKQTLPGAVRELWN
jgi:uncharacterized protein (DUF2267 family)